jgi:hypothetical protein
VSPTKWYVGGDIGSGVYENGLQAGIVVGLAVQQEDAGVGGDGDSDLIGHPEPAAAFETLLGHENEDVPPQFLLIGLGQPAVKRARSS